MSPLSGLYDSRSDSLLVFPIGVKPKFGCLFTVTDIDDRIQLRTQECASSRLALEKGKFATCRKVTIKE